MRFPYFVTNKRGIPCLESQSVSVNGTTNVRFTFKEYPFLQSFAGLILFKLSAIPSGTTTTLLLVAVINGKEVPLTDYAGTALTVASLTSEGIHAAYGNSSSAELALLTGVA